MLLLFYCSFSKRGSVITIVSLQMNNLFFHTQKFEKSYTRIKKHLTRCLDVRLSAAKKMHPSLSGIWIGSGFQIENFKHHNNWVLAFFYLQILDTTYSSCFPACFSLMFYISIVACFLSSLLLFWLVLGARG